MKSVDTAWSDLREHVDGAVAELPANLRDPIVLCFFEDQTHEQIAQSLGVSRQVVTYRIHKGVEGIRKSLSSKGVTSPAAAGLITLVHENIADALPPQFVADLSRIALSAKPSIFAAAATLSGSLLFKTAAVAALVVLAGFSAREYMSPDDQIAPTEPTGSLSQITAVAERSTPEAEVTLVDENHPKSTPGTIVLSARESNGTQTESGDSETDEEFDLCSLSGIVTLPDGRPYVNAHVTLFKAESMDAGSWPPGTRFELKTDGGGRFEQQDMKPAMYRVLITESEFSGINQYNVFAVVELRAGEKHPDLKLVFGTEGNLTLSGVVVDSRGNPIEGVKVFKFGPVPRTDMSDSYGRFTLRYLPDDDVEVNTRKEGYQCPQVVAAAGVQNIRLVMYGQGAISGQVIDANTLAPIEAFEIEVRTGHARAFRSSLSGKKRDYEDLAGSFEIEKMYSGEKTVIANAPGYHPAMVHTTVVEYETVKGLELKLVPTEEIPLVGRVVTADGSPISGAKIYMDGIPNPVLSFRGIAAVSDADGRFELDSVLPDVVFLSALHSDFTPASATITEFTTIVLQKPARLNINVSSMGEPLVNKQIEAYYREEPSSPIGGAISDANGDAALERITPGDVLVLVQLSNTRQHRHFIHMDPGEEKSIQIDVAPAEADVEGFLMINGTPLTMGFVEMYVETDYGSEVFRKRLSGDGSFLFQSVPVGRARFGGLGGMLERVELAHDVQIIAGEVTFVNIDITANRMILGLVSGIHDGDSVAITVLRGDLAFDEASDIDRAWGLNEDKIVGFGNVLDSCEFETSLIEPGIYTLLLETFPTKDHSNKSQHESRVVEVSDSEDLNLVFRLNY